MRYILSAALVLAGLIHLPPLVGVLGADHLSGLYGVAVEGPDMQILMRHRAVLLGIIGGFLIVAGFVRTLQLGALVVGFISVVSFLWLAWSTGGYNESLDRVVMADIVALVLLLLGAAAYFHSRRQA